MEDVWKASKAELAWTLIMKRVVSSSSCRSIMSLLVRAAIAEHSRSYLSVGIDFWCLLGLGDLRHHQCETPSRASLWKIQIVATAMLWRSAGGFCLWVSHISAPRNLRLKKRMPYLCVVTSRWFFHDSGFQSWLLNVISACCGIGSVQTLDQCPRTAPHHSLFKSHKSQI